ncbi:MULTISPECIES: DUF2971 domain-containing protein [Bacillus cereus group]|uniref:DUF2971 domain-containing protein n=1 Tax=Bacillus cereus TaxID=1396 RepID=A0A9W7QF64_BACCE|nr:DUF2971 domain-containing protein [Bacillus cereus]KAB2395279.1 DUF2971 domain-containing protein [Bacillus cereus]KAB2407474.1 DUF2971 domain-containing protein [Bacillus cereus]KAB2431486.1 DUF2971 domain-containing protein [Bacillus cereus]PEW72838.1 hypothetical protein CN448_05765 [Bacillus cereus]
MDLEYKGQAVFHAMEFEGVYDYYDELYKVKNNPIIWRYMDISKFKSLLNQRALFFAKPSAFVDPLEGSYSMWDIEGYRTNGDPILPREYMKKIQDFAGISCWHMNDQESAGMWDLYLNSQDGVAIKTKYGNLVNSVGDLRYRLFAGKVQYIDFNKDMTSRNIYDTLFFKRKSFSHENELRFMIVASRYDENWLHCVFDEKYIPYYKRRRKMERLEEESYKFSHSNGNLISCDLELLIDEIYVSPKSSPEFFEQVKQLVEGHGLSHKRIIQSDLYTDYIY